MYKRKPYKCQYDSDDDWCEKYCETICTVCGNGVCDEHGDLCKSCETMTCENCSHTEKECKKFTIITDKIHNASDKIKKKMYKMYRMNEKITTEIDQLNKMNSKITSEIDQLNSKIDKITELFEAIVYAPNGIKYNEALKDFEERREKSE